MLVGTVKEIKTHEYRVGLTPSCVSSYTARGHQVLVQKNAGESAGFSDNDYRQAGAEIVDTPEEIFQRAEMIIKVKEPLASEYDLMRKDQIIFTYLHLAADQKLTEIMLKRKVKAIAYETIEIERHLPCLQPMSEIAGRLSVQEGAKYLEKTYGGRGILLGGVPGVHRGKVGIIGGGVVGTNACKIAVGMGADVTILDINSRRLAYLDDIFGSRITTLYGTDTNIRETLESCDLIIGAVLTPGAKAPKLIKRQMLKHMKKGAVIVDVAIDQGGCTETSKATTHDDPVYVIDNVVHYCVANMPGAVALSSTNALTSTTLPYGLLLAEHGFEKACKISAALKKGANVYKGFCVYKSVAEAFDIEYTELNSIME